MDVKDVCSVEQRPLQEIITFLRSRQECQERAVADMVRRAEAAEKKWAQRWQDVMAAQDEAARAAADREACLVESINTKMTEFRTELMTHVEDARGAADACDRRVTAAESTALDTSRQLSEFHATLGKMNEAVAARIEDECSKRFAEVKASVVKRTERLAQGIQNDVDERMAQLTAVREKFEVQVDAQEATVAALMKDFAALQQEVAAMSESHRAQIPVVSDLRASVNLNIPDLWAKQKELKEKAQSDADRMAALASAQDKHVAALSARHDEAVADLRERADGAARGVQTLKETLSQFTAEVENGLNEVKQASAKEAGKLRRSCQEVWDKTKEQLTTCQECIKSDIDGVKVFIEEHQHEVEGKIEKKVRGVRKHCEASIDDVRARIADVARQTDEGLQRREDAAVSAGTRMNELDRKIDAMERVDKERVRAHNQLAESFRSQTDYIAGELERKVLTAQERAEKHVDKRVLSLSESLEREARVACEEEAERRQQQLQALLTKLEKTDTTLRQDLSDVKSRNGTLEKSVLSVYSLFGIDRSIGAKTESMTETEKVNVVCNSPAFVALKTDVLLNHTQQTHATHYTPSHAPHTPTPGGRGGGNLTSSWLSPHSAAPPLPPPPAGISKSDLGMAVRGNPGRRGAEVTHVARHGLADTHGLCRGDRILYINGLKVDTEYDFDAVLNAPAPEMKVTHIPAGGEHPTTIDIRGAG